jgi:hypothetical protein
MKLTERIYLVGSGSQGFGLTDDYDCHVYLGEHGPEYLEPSRSRPRYLVKFIPETIVSWEGVEWHPKYLSETEND